MDQNLKYFWIIFIHSLCLDEILTMLEFFYETLKTKVQLEGWLNLVETPQNNRKVKVTIIFNKKKPIQNRINRLLPSRLLSPFSNMLNSANAYAIIPLLTLYQLLYLIPVKYWDFPTLSCTLPYTNIHYIASNLMGTISPSLQA